MNHALNHLKKDPVFNELIKKHQLDPLPSSNNFFLDLVKIIVSQQLSTKVATTITRRLEQLFSGVQSDQITPSVYLKTEDEILRGIGLSGSKVTYTKNVAIYFQKHQRIVDNLKQLTEEEIREALITIKGVGPWSIDMFLIFSLQKPDVFSPGDLGLRQAIQNLYAINREDKTAIEKLQKNWSPFRSTASRLLWKSLDNQ